MYYGLTPSICLMAWEMILPAITESARLGVTNKHKGTIVVLDPTKFFTGEADLMPDTVMFTRFVGERENPEYARIAHAKAYVSWRTGLPSREVQQRAPHLYVPDMTKWGGSVVRDNLIVAFSGVQAVYDEMIADWMASAIIAICRHEMTKPGGVMAGPGSFIGGTDRQFAE